MTERPLRIIPLSTVDAAAIAALTRAAYRDSDPLPGLPVPDGARETAAAVRAGLDRGATVWLAEDTGGRPVGTLRVTVGPDGAWEVGRVSVAPALRGRGVARQLLAAVDTAAARDGVPVLRLDAVVERCLPSLYARLGFRPVRHWPSDDKALTEVTMERVPGTPAPEPRLWAGTAPVGTGRHGLPSGPLLLWLVTPDALLAVFGAENATDHPDALLAGIDRWHGAGPAERGALQRRFAARGRPLGNGATAFPPDRGALRAHVMPRTVDPRLHALCRLPPGAEIPVVPSVAVRCS
jgi:GNAT superfamily N-acetyltransferase